MALTLDATPKGAASNSYATRAQADSYHEAHLYATDWTAAANMTKDAALVWATRILDEQVEWLGIKRTVEQALRWPRSGIWDRDGYALDYDTVPAFLANATAELARYLIGDDRSAEPSRGMRRVRAGEVDIEFDKGDRRPVLPPAVVAMIAPFGEVRQQSGMARLVRV